jgi:hypothetical protein
MQKYKQLDGVATTRPKAIPQSHKIIKADGLSNSFIKHAVKCRKARLLFFRNIYSKP